MSALPKTMALPPAYMEGLVIGCVTAVLIASLVSYCVTSSARAKSAKAIALAPVPSRRERAKRLLEQLRQEEQQVQQARSSTATAAVAEDAGNEVANGVHGDDSDSSHNNNSCSSDWASTSDDAEDEEDSEYDRMEELRLKMVFVVRHPVQPKISAQEVAVLTATAAVQLVELHQRNNGSSSLAVAGSRSHEESLGSSPELMPFTPNAEDQQRWLQWYLWWNRIGCAKITLKCPDIAMMEEVVRCAAELRLPAVQLRRSQFGSQEDGVMAEKAVVPPNVDEAVLIALGPAPADLLEPVTGALKLFS